jgi:hypothetical protein
LPERLYRSVRIGSSPTSSSSSNVMRTRPQRAGLNCVFSAHFPLVSHSARLARVRARGTHRAHPVGRTRTPTLNGKRSGRLEPRTGGSGSEQPSPWGRARPDAGRLCTKRSGGPGPRRQRLWSNVKNSLPYPQPGRGRLLPPAYVHSLIEIRYANRIYVSLPRARYD